MSQISCTINHNESHCIANNKYSFKCSSRKHICLCSLQFFGGGEIIHWGRYWERPKLLLQKPKTFPFHDTTRWAPDKQICIFPRTCRQSLWNLIPHLVLQWLISGLRTNHLPNVTMNKSPHTIMCSFPKFYVLVSLRMIPINSKRRTEDLLKI